MPETDFEVSGRLAYSVFNLSIFYVHGLRAEYEPATFGKLLSWPRLFSGLATLSRRELQPGSGHGSGRRAFSFADIVRLLEFPLDASEAS